MKVRRKFLAQGVIVLASMASVVLPTTDNAAVGAQPASSATSTTLPGTAGGVSGPTPPSSIVEDGQTFRLVTPGSSAQQVVQPDTTYGTYALPNQGNGLNMTDGGNPAGYAVQFYAAKAGDNNQRWNFNYSGSSPWYELQNVGDGKCADNYGTSTNQQTDYNVQILEPCSFNNTASNEYYLWYQGSYTSIFKVYDYQSFCLTSAGSTTLEIYTCNGSANQQFAV